MAMPLWLGRPREFEHLDRAINDLARKGDAQALTSLSLTLDSAIGGAGVVNKFLDLEDGSTTHFKEHWVGDYSQDTPPLYWPYAWGSDPKIHKQRVLIDRLMAFGMKRSIDRMAARAAKPSADFPCPSHFTVWICLRALSDGQLALAYVDKEYRKKLFRIGVAESRDAVVFVITTPHPGEHDRGAGLAPDYVEPVVVTHGFTDGETPTWNPLEGGSHASAGSSHGAPAPPGPGSGAPSGNG